MRYEMLVGLWVKNDELYTTYREKLKPFLAKYDGGFRYDFTIEKVLKSDSENPINRVFAINFKDRSSMDSFFSDPGYLVVKEKYFSESVSVTTIMAKYEV